MCYELLNKQYYLHRAHSSFLWDTNILWFVNRHKLLMITFIFGINLEVLVIMQLCRSNIIKLVDDRVNWISDSGSARKLGQKIEAFGDNQCKRVNMLHSVIYKLRKLWLFLIKQVCECKGFGLYLVEWDPYLAITNY